MYAGCRAQRHVCPQGLGTAGGGQEGQLGVHRTASAPASGMAFLGLSVAQTALCRIAGLGAGPGPGVAAGPARQVQRTVSEGTCPPPAPLFSTASG